LWAAHTRAQGAAPGALSAAIVTGRQAANLFIRVLGTEASAFEALTQAGKLVQSAQAVAMEEVVLWGADDTTREALWSAWVASRYALPTLRSQATKAKAAHAPPQPPVAVPVALGLAALWKWQAVERGGALARWLTALPGNHLTPALYRKRVQALARQQGWKLVIDDEAALRRAGAGAFLAVAQGNAAADACLIRVQYRPTRKPGKSSMTPVAPVALVGKGVCFDTGGVNLKPHRSMLDMHTDMAGSAVALGTLLALTESINMEECHYGIRATSL
jgi:leucyl aminopeptidase